MSPAFSSFLWLKSYPNWRHAKITLWYCRKKFFFSPTFLAALVPVIVVRIPSLSWKPLRKLIHKATFSTTSPTVLRSILPKRTLICGNSGQICVLRFFILPGFVILSTTSLNSSCSSWREFKWLWTRFFWNFSLSASYSSTISKSSHSSQIAFEIG